MELVIWRRKCNDRISRYDNASSFWASNLPQSIGSNFFWGNVFPGNKILNKMGLSLLADILAKETYKVPESSQAIVDKYHFRHLLYKFAGHVLEENELSQQETESLRMLGRDCAKYLQMKAHSSSSYMQVLLALYDLIVKTGMPQVRRQLNHPNDRLPFRAVTVVIVVVGV